jgi:hypothetical protein
MIKTAIAAPTEDDTPHEYAMLYLPDNTRFIIDITVKSEVGLGYKRVCKNEEQAALHRFKPWSQIHELVYAPEHITNPESLLQYL